MKTTNFTYSAKPRRLYEMKRDSGYIQGIDLSTMPENEVKAFTKIVDKFYEDLKPYTEKYFRNFMIQKIQGAIALSD